MCVCVTSIDRIPVEMGKLRDCDSQLTSFIYQFS